MQSTLTELVLVTFFTKSS